MPAIADMNMTVYGFRQRVMTPLGTLDGILLNYDESVGCRGFEVTLNGYEPMSLAIRLHGLGVRTVHIGYGTKGNVDILAPYRIVM